MTLKVFHVINGALTKWNRSPDIPVGTVDPFTYRQSLTIGTYKPDASTCGLLNDPARPLTVFSGDYTASTAGASIKDLQINGRLIINADNVTVDNCWVRGPQTAWSGSDTGCVLVTSPTRNAVLRDCLIDPAVPAPRLDGIRYCGYTAIRCRIRNTTDGFGVFNTSGGAMNVSILGSWVENMAKFYPDEGVHTNGTHNDAIQLQGGSTATITGNRLESVLSTTAGNTSGLDVTSSGTAKSPPCTVGNSVIQLNSNTGPLTDVTIDSNYMYGGIMGINGLNTSFNTPSNLTGLVVTNNRFDHNQYQALSIDGRIGIQAPASVTLNNNTYEDTGAPVEVKRT